MRLADHFTHSGDVLFRRRSHLPLLLLPPFAMSLLDWRGRGLWEGRTAWDAACLTVSLAGLLLRVWVIGRAPKGTSERSTVTPRASRLSTAGVYSVVRHPLYVGNTLVAMGLAGVAGRWYLPVIVLLASLLYHERITSREEAFLEATFGAEFRAWADRVPALWPSWRHFTPSHQPFDWRDVLRRECHGLFVIGAGFFLLTFSRDSLASGRPVLTPAWAWLAGVTGALFAVLTAVKRVRRAIGERG